MQIETSNQFEDPRDKQNFVFHRTIFRRFFVGTFRLLLPIVIKVETKGFENIPKKGPVILASNHLTNYDVFPMQMVIERPLFFMAKSELHKNPILDFALRSLGAFPVHRGQKDQWALRHAEKVLDHEQILAIFPEGTRSNGKGLKAGKTGAARLSIQTNCPIVPTAITGTHLMFQNFPRRSEVSITVGDPMILMPGESTLGMTDRLMFSIADLLPEELRGVYSHQPKGFD